MEDKNTSGSAANAENAASGSAPAKKAAKSKAKAQRPKATHPSTAEMVTSAIKELKDRKGSSVQAIKKYIASTYKVDGEKFAPFIKRYLKTAVTSGAVVQTKGKGASGSFKLPTTKKPVREVKKRTPKKQEVAVEESFPEEKAAKKAPKAARIWVKTKKTTAEKKPASPKKKPAPPSKPAAAKKKETAAKQKAVAQAKNLSKTKKSPAGKAKAPKPKAIKVKAKK